MFDRFQYAAGPYKLDAEWIGRWAPTEVKVVPNGVFNLLRVQVDELEVDSECQVMSRVSFNDGFIDIEFFYWDMIGDEELLGSILLYDTDMLGTPIQWDVQHLSREKGGVVKILFQKVYNEN